MARKVAVFLAIFMAVIAIAYAADPFDDNIPAVTPAQAADSPDSSIGALDEGDGADTPGAAEAGPVGGPVAAGVFGPSSSSSTLEVSAVAAVIAAAGYFF